MVIFYKTTAETDAEFVFGRTDGNMEDGSLRCDLNVNVRHRTSLLDDEDKGKKEGEMTEENNGGEKEIVVIRNWVKSMN